MGVDKMCTHFGENVLSHFKKKGKRLGVVDHENGGRLFYFSPFFPLPISNNPTKADSKKTK
jgi:hypothetical protein